LLGQAIRKQIVELRPSWFNWSSLEFTGQQRVLATVKFDGLGEKWVGRNRSLRRYRMLGRERWWGSLDFSERRVAVCYLVVVLEKDVVISDSVVAWLKGCVWPSWMYRCLMMW
jgi:hypothetical protein